MPQRFPGPEPTEPDNTTPNELETGENTTTDGDMIQCLSYVSETTEYATYETAYSSTDGYPLANGFSNNDVSSMSSCDYVAMSPTQLVSYVSYAWENNFDPDVYDMAYGAVLQSWALGLGIGLIIAVISKLKR